MNPGRPWLVSDLTPRPPEGPSAKAGGPEEPYAPLHAAEARVPRPRPERVTPAPDLRTFLAGLPALAAGLALLAAVVWIRTHREVVPRYERDASNASRAKDSASAYVAFRRLSIEKPNRADYRFGLALALETLGQRALSLNLVRQLAPADQPGFPPAQLWLSAKLLGSPKPTPALLQAAEAHLRQYLKADPTSGEARTMLGQVFARTGRSESARPYLEEASRERKGVLIELATVYRRLGQNEAAGRVAREALVEYEKAVEADPGATVPRLLLSETTAFLGDFPGAVAVIEDGLNRSKSSAFTRMKSRLYGEWAHTVGSRAKPGDESAAGEVVDLLGKAVAADPDDPTTVDRLVPVMTFAKGSASEKARSLLQTLADGRESAAALANLALGNDLYARKDVAGAGDRWERSLKLDPTNAMTNNNVAWFLSTRGPADLPRAVRLVDVALKARPKEPTYLGTRGEILLKMGRVEEALADLQAAVDAGANSPEVNNALDDALARLGRPPAPRKKDPAPAG